MSLFHSHVWNEVKRKFFSPIKTYEFTGSQEQFGRIFYGFTVIELICPICRLIKHVETLGDMSHVSNNVERVGIKP